MAKSELHTECEKSESPLLCTGDFAQGRKTYYPQGSDYSPGISLRRDLWEPERHAVNGLLLGRALPDGDRNGGGLFSTARRALLSAARGGRG